MIIDKSDKVTKVIATICAICALFSLILTFRRFVLYRFIVALSNMILAFVCFKGIDKDQELCVGVFGVMSVYEIVRIFLEESIAVTSGILMLLKILGYIVIVAYLLGVLKNKIFPMIGGVVIVLLLLKNAYNLIAAYRNIQTITNSLGGQRSFFSGTMLINILGVLTYVVPTLAIIILIAVGAIKFTK